MSNSIVERLERIDREVAKLVESHKSLYEALESVQQQLSYYVGNPSAWPEGYSEMMSNIIRDALENIPAALAKARGEA